MTGLQIDESNRRQPLRLWPGVAIAVVQFLVWWVLPRVVPGTTVGYVSVLGGVLCGLLVVVWWLFLSRAAGYERWGALVVAVVALLVTSRLVHESIATLGQGMLFIFYAIPMLSFAFVAWAVVTRNLSDGVRRVAMVATLLVASGGWALVKTGGISSTGTDFSWRWAATAEERLLAREGDQPRAPAPVPGAAVAEPGWPGFRGPNRDGVVAGARIGTDWSASPPLELWRRPIGPGWSSFAVQGDLLFTQEQRGDQEMVSCYLAATGEAVWRHGDPVRFWEANAGAGPRATPTLSGSRVFTFGATGLLNVLEADDGDLVWSRDVAADTDTEIPYWGFSGSPLVVDDLVVAAAAGQLAAYDLATGEPRWLGPEGGAGHSSPHLLTIDGVRQIVLASRAGITGVAPTDGTVLWEHAWNGFPIVQPAQAGGDLLVSVSETGGLRRLGVARAADGWALEERWTSLRLKPYFNDFVVHERHVYGFDGGILASIELENGERRWKGGRYGQGQLVLLPEQDLLLVLSEKGELALVAATPERFTELARLPAIEGKTWNHPVLVGDRLLVRNASEMAAFRLPAAGG